MILPLSCQDAVAYPGVPGLEAQATLVTLSLIVVPQNASVLMKDGIAKALFNAAEQL
jgi:hypothetical protein